jgi:hypothetical protein
MRNYFKRVRKGLPRLTATVCAAATAAGFVAGFVYAVENWPLSTFLVACTATIVHTAWVLGDD